MTSDVWDLPIKEGDIVVVKPETVNPGLSVYERAFVCDGCGFGTAPKAKGSAVFGDWLDGTAKGRTCRIERHWISKLETMAFRDGVAYVSVLVLQDKEENAKVNVPGLLRALEDAAVRLDLLTNWIENSHGGSPQDVELGRSYARAARAVIDKEAANEGVD